MTFLNILPYNNTNTTNPLALKVLTELSITRDITLTKIEQSNGGTTKYHSYYNSGDGGYIFQIKILVDKDDTWMGKRVYTWLNNWYANMTPVSIVIDHFSIPNGVYYISNAQSRETTKRNIIKMELEFTQRKNPKAVKTVPQAKQTNKTTLAQHLKKCKLTKLKKGDKKTCVAYLNKALIKTGCLKSKYKGKTYTKHTKTAIKKFKKKWNKKKLKPKLSKSAKIDKNTQKAIRRYKELKK